MDYANFVTIASHVARHSLNWQDKNFYSCSACMNAKSILAQKYCPCRSHIQEDHLLHSPHLPALPKQITNWHLAARTPETSVKMTSEWYMEK